MKRLISAVILLAVITALCVINAVTVKSAHTKLSEKLEICIEAYNKDDTEKAFNTATQLENDWEKREEILSIFVDHDIIDDLGVSISRLPALAKEDSDTFLAECNAVKITLTHMIKDISVNAHTLF